jgi:hypothetical protein
VSTQQKSALYQLIIGLASVALYALLYFTVSAAVAPAAMALLAPTGAVPFLFRREMSDERERYLGRQASLAGFAAAYLFVVAVCMGTWFQHFRSGESTVGIDLLPIIAGGTWLTALIVRAATLLLLAPRALDVSD